MRKVTVVLAVLAIALLGPWAALPAAADASLEGPIDVAVTCPDPGSIQVLGVVVALDAATIFRGQHGQPIPCTDLQAGDTVSVRCTDATCATAARVSWKEPVSAESSIAVLVDGDSFTLGNGVTCDVRPDAKVRDKKHFLGPLANPTVADLFAFLGTATLGTTPGTVEVECEGHNLGPNIDTTKVELKK